MCLAVDRDQSQIVLRYVKSYFQTISFLRQMVQRETVNGLELTNGVDIVVVTNDFRVVRGRPILCAILDECAFWRDEHSAAPDTETYGALVPGTLTLPGSLIIGISTPYRRGGLLYDQWKGHHGQPGDVLVIRAPSLALNPTLDRRAIDRELARDPQAGKAEWLAEWRDDVAAYLDRALIEAAVDRGVTVRPPVPGVEYRGFADPSGGVSDSFAIAIAHREPDGTVVLDALVEQRAPLNPAQTTARMATVLRSYGLREVRGDRYSAGWVQECFRSNEIAYVHSDLDRSAIYAEALPLFTAGRARLLDNDRLTAQFAALERKTSARGDRIDHPRGQGHHDDAANAAAGALMLAATSRYDVPRAVAMSWDGDRARPKGLTRLQQEARHWSVPSTLRRADFGCDGDPERQAEAMRRFFEAQASARPVPPPAPPSRPVVVFRRTERWE
jgi:hypothetical protein